MPIAVYNGDRAVVHQVQHGETLSSIATQYRGFRTWTPIHVFNTKVRQVLGPNPDMLPIGTKLFIPRNRAGYDKLIRKLEDLKTQCSVDADRVKYELEGEYNKHQAERVLFDLAGDIATLIGTVAAKAASAARSAKVAATATGNAKVAAQYLADKEAEALAKGLAHSLKDKAVGALAGTVDEDLAGAHKTYLTGKKGLEAIRGVSLRGGKSFLDMADILLDYATVSNVADFAISVMVGETPGETYEGALKMIEQSAQSSNRMLDEKITARRRERDLVWTAGS